MFGVEMGLTLMFFCRYDRHCTSFQWLYTREAPNHRSLQSELQDVQQVGNMYRLEAPCTNTQFHMTFRHLHQHHRPLDEIRLPPLIRHCDDIQSVIHRIKSADIFRQLRQCSEKVRRNTVGG